MDSSPPTSYMAMPQVSSPTFINTVICYIFSVSLGFSSDHTLSNMSSKTNVFQYSSSAFA